jgi:phospholipid/cholesterol/gamma-HCH transport system ATP-binding protein
LIRVEGLYKSYGGSAVLEDISLEIHGGEELSLIGPTGCGKTVLAKHFNGLLEPDAGRVIVFGHDVAAATPAEMEEICRRIGYVFQGNVLFDSDIASTVYGNVSLPLRRDPYDYPAANEAQIESRVAEVLEEVGLGREYFTRAPSELSGGQKKRVALARAIAPNPPVVIYDEPTTGLDPEYTGIIVDLIDKVHQSSGNTTIVITHEKKLMRRLGRVVFLRDRRVHFDGAYEDFARSGDPVIVSFLAEDDEARLQATAFKNTA